MPPPPPTRAATSHRCTSHFRRTHPLTHGAGNGGPGVGQPLFGPRPPHRRGRRGGHVAPARAHGPRARGPRPRARAHGGGAAGQRTEGQCPAPPAAGQWSSSGEATQQHNATQPPPSGTLGPPQSARSRVAAVGHRPTAVGCVSTAVNRILPPRQPQAVCSELRRPHIPFLNESPGPVKHRAAPERGLGPPSSPYSPPPYGTGTPPATPDGLRGDGHGATEHRRWKLHR